MTGLENALLRLDGMPQSTIDEIEKALPSLAALLTLYQANAAMIRDAQALAAKALPLIDKAIAEINVVAPAALDAVKFFQKSDGGTA